MLAGENAKEEPERKIETKEEEKNENLESNESNAGAVE